MNDKAFLNLKNTAGKTCTDLAKEANRRTIVTYLTSKGGGRGGAAPAAPGGGAAPAAKPISTDGKCGPENGNTMCKDGKCCSQHGWCGTTDEYCKDGCQPNYGKCGAAPAAPGGGVAPAAPGGGPAPADTSQKGNASKCVACAEDIIGVHKDHEWEGIYTIKAAHAKITKAWSVKGKNSICASCELDDVKNAVPLMKRFAEAKIDKNCLSYLLKEVSDTGHTGDYNVDTLEDDWPLQGKRGQAGNHCRLMYVKEYQEAMRDAVRQKVMKSELAGVSSSADTGDTSGLGKVCSRQFLKKFCSSYDKNTFISFLQSNTAFDEPLVKSNYDKYKGDLASCATKEDREYTVSVWKNDIAKLKQETCNINACEKVLKSQQFKDKILLSNEGADSLNVWTIPECSGCPNVWFDKKKDWEKFNVGKFNNNKTPQTSWSGIYFTGDSDYSLYYEGIDNWKNKWWDIPKGADGPVKYQSMIDTWYNAALAFNRIIKALLCSQTEIPTW